MERIKQRPGLAALVVAVVLLPMGIWGPGLWDPWEMNRAFVARRMAEAPAVLVVEARPRADAGSLAGALSGQIGDDATVVSTAELASPGAALETARSNLADHIYPVVVLDLDARMKGTGDEDGLKPYADLLKTAAPQNLSTSFLLVSASGAVDASVALSSVLARVGAADPDGEIVNAISSSTRAVAGAPLLPGEVSDELAGDGFVAQFKASGRTSFMAPLYPFLVSLSFRAFGQNEFAARLPGVLLAALVLVLVYLGARRAFGETEAALGVVALATSPLFFGSARFVANEQAFVLFLGLGCVAFGAIVTGRGGRAALPVLLSAALALWLGSGMTGVLALTAVVVAFPIAAWDGRREVLTASGAVAATAAVLAILTFVPDGAFWRQFRFTAATFAGGMRQDERAFDFALKQVGFGLFPWSVLLPVAVMTVVGTGEKPKPERLILLLWAVAPLAILLVTVRPLHHTLYAGVPALAMLVALYLREVEDDPIQSRLLAFFGVGLFAVMLKDVLQSPAPLVSFLTTDPMFSQPGKGDIVFPAMKLPLVAKAAIALAGATILVGGGRLISFATGLPALLSRGRVFRWVMVAMAGIIVLDIVIFLALKWDIVSGAAGPDAAVAPVVLRIFLTGPDIAALYAVTLLLVAARYAGSIRARLAGALGEGRVARIGALVSTLERPRATAFGVATGAVGLAAMVSFVVYPELSYHLSQKHIIETYEASSAAAPGDLYRHGVFAGRGSEDSNFYTGQVRDMASRSDVVDRLKDPARRTFFIVPKTQWSEINSSFRQAAGGRFPPVLDDRSSRFILVASSLAPGEPDRNWLAGATLSEAQFDALTDVTRETVDFDGKVQFVGYSLDQAAVRRGGKAILKTYFKCTDKVPVSYRIFMHIDRQGSSSRIHGDHWILNLVAETEEQTSCVGCYATTHWLKGDIVVDTYEINVPIGSPSGPHDIWFGFYNPGDDKRLPVKDFDKAKIRHDGQNRVRIGVLTVE